MNEALPESPALRCDIVLKGGVTSGVVYPRATCEIAKAFRFVNIGGTSAGAIAASLTAAAEYRRQSSVDRAEFAGFELMNDIPNWLAEDNRLAKLFRPNSIARPYFDFITDLVGRGDPRQKVDTLLRTLFGPLLPATASGAAVGVILGVIAALLGHGIVLVPAILSTLLLAVAGGVLAAATTGIAGFFRTFTANGYGLCSGIADGKDAADDTVLDAWLSAKIDAIAGMPGGRPLTFGDLWMGRLTTPLDPEIFEDVHAPLIRLEAIRASGARGFHPRALSEPYVSRVGPGNFAPSPSQIRT